MDMLDLSFIHRRLDSRDLRAISPVAVAVSFPSPSGPPYSIDTSQTNPKAPQINLNYCPK